MTMASSVDNSDKVDLSTCSICFETFKNPKYFPCLHSFCEGCIKRYITTTFQQIKKGVSCPLCRMYVSKPDDINVEEWCTKLPTNHILVSLIDMNDSKSDEKICADCARENETESACSWCINCAEFLCKSCQRSHRRNKYTRTHELTDVGHFETSELKIRHADFQCTVHPDKNVEMFCRDHSEVCCMTCAFLKHRTCKNVRSIQDAAEEMKKSKEVESFPDCINNLKKSLDLMVQYMTENLQNFDKDVEKIKSDVDMLFVKISDHLNKLKSNIMSEIFKIEKEIRPEIEDKHDEMKCKISIIENDLALFQTNMRYAPPAQFLQAMNKLMEQRMILEQFLNEEGQKIQEIRVTFDGIEQLMAIVEDFGIFGKVNLRRTSTKDLVVSTDTDINMSTVVPTLSSAVDIGTSVTGIAILENGQILFSYHSNNTIELRDHQCSSILSSLALPGCPWGIKMTSDTDGAVAVMKHGLVIFNIQNNQITKIKEIKTNVKYDFVYHQGKYYVGCDQNIALYDSNLRKVPDISVKHKVGCMAVRDDTSLCYTVWGGRELYSITMDGTPVFTYTHSKLLFATGVTVDHAGYIYVCDYKSMNVHQLSHDGKLQGIIFDNLPLSPCCVSFNKLCDKAVIGCYYKVLLFDLK